MKKLTMNEKKQETIRDSKNMSTMRSPWAVE
jgi:hypothetical protein